MSTRTDVCRWPIVLLTLALLSLPGLARPAAAQEDVVVEADASEAGLAAEIARHFRVLRLTDRDVLEPTAGGGPVAVELIGDELAIDAVTVSPDEVRARLDPPAAEAILALVGMDAEARAEILGVASSLGSSVSVTPPAVTPPIGAVPPPPPPPSPPRHPRVHKDSRVVFGDNVVVGEGESVEEIVVFGGNLDIEGEVQGDAVVIGGNLKVSGPVGGDALAVGGQVQLLDSAVVGGDVVAVGGSIDRAASAVVGGEINEVPFGSGIDINFKPWSGAGSWGHRASRVHEGFQPWRWIGGLAWNVLGILILTLFVCLAWLLGRGPVTRMRNRIEDEPWKALLVGLVSQVLFVPLLILVVLVLAISIIGIPLLLLVPFVLFALGILGLLGFAASVHRLGEWVTERFSWRFAGPYALAIVGIVAIKGWDLISDLLSFGPTPLRIFGVMFGLFSAVLCYVAATAGFGSVLLTRFGTADRWDGSPKPPPALPEVQPVDPQDPPPGGWVDTDQ